MKKNFPIAVLTLPACAPGLKPGALLPAPTTVAVAPVVAGIRPGLDRASEVNAALREKADDTAKEAGAAKRLAEEAAAEAGRLAETGVAAEGELARLAGLAAKTRELRDRNRGLEEGYASVSQLLDTQSKALDEARAAQADALAAASTGDAAQHILSQQLQATSVQYQQAETARQMLAKSTAVKDARLGQLRLWLTWSLLAIAGYLALRIAKLTPWGRVFLFWIP